MSHEKESIDQLSLENELLSEVLMSVSGLPSGTKVIIGYSGGIDSTVLLYLCSAIKAKGLTDVDFLALHVNHQLSPNAEEWGSHCQAEARKRDIPLCIKKIKVRDPRRNVENQAREERYKALSSVSDKNRGSPVLLAHHRGDLIENVFLRMARGSSPSAITSLKERGVSHGITKLRPLLKASKEDLTKVAKHRGLSWVEDPSNHEGKFSRNMLRNEIIPKLEDHFNGFSSAFIRSIELISEEAELVRDESIRKLKKLMASPSPLVISRDMGAMSHAWKTRVITEWLKMNGIFHFRRSQLEAITQMSLSSSKSGNDLIVIGDHIIRRCREYFVVQRNQDIYQDLEKAYHNNHSVTLLEWVNQNSGEKKSAKKIAPQWLWSALPVIKSTGGFFVVGINGKTYPIKQDSLK